ncbi:MAG TPA: response regulator [Clostridia bacterium]|nr:response regulator [Clostridia bacterium]
MLKILIVEDEDIIRKGLVHTIDWLSMGCNVVGDTWNGIEGLKMIEKYLPDIVITDIKMPFMDGIEMLQRALEKHKFYSIILTSYSEFEYAKKAITLKVSEYLLKPIDEEKLYEIIEKIKSEINDKKFIEDLYGKIKKYGEINLVNLDVYLISGEKSDYYVNQALVEIKENYDKKISIKSIAEKLGVSVSYLSRKFKDVTSETFMDLLNKYRVQKAIELLLTGKYKVYEVADMTGFGEYKNFCNIFKKYLNMSPTEFIKSNSCIIYKK